MTKRMTFLLWRNWAVLFKVRRLKIFYTFGIFVHDLPLHRVLNPVHVPLAWHVLMTDPLRINPGSQSNWTLLGNTVMLPEEEPFMGTDNGPQSTAKSRNESFLVPCVTYHLRKLLYLIEPINDSTAKWIVQNRFFAHIIYCTRHSMIFRFLEIHESDWLPKYSLIEHDGAHFVLVICCLDCNSLACPLKN